SCWLAPRSGSGDLRAVEGILMSQLFSVDYLDVVQALLRQELPGVNVFTKIPDGVPEYCPLVVIRRIGGDSPAPEFYDGPWLNIQTWAAEDRANGIDADRAAFYLADAVRGVLWRAYRTQKVVSGLGWINYIRESSAPQAIPDRDPPHHGRYTATYDLRVRPGAGRGDPHPRTSPPLPGAWPFVMPKGGLPWLFSTLLSSCRGPVTCTSPRRRRPLRPTCPSRRPPGTT